MRNADPIAVAALYAARAGEAEAYRSAYASSAVLNVEQTRGY
jgi:hypothetical protein